MRQSVMFFYAIFNQWFKCLGVNRTTRVSVKSLMLLMLFVSFSSHGQVPVRNVAKIATGSAFSCALTTVGGVKCWGDNQYGQLGVGDTTRYSATAVDVVGLQSGVSAIATGSSHACALTTAGGVKCWGNNGAYQLGDGTVQTRYTPISVPAFVSGVSAIAAAGSQTCVLTSVGGVKCWGYNNLAYNVTPIDIAGLTSNVTTVTAGLNHVCGITVSGGAKCWGYNGLGQLGNGTMSSQSVAVDVVGLTSGVVAIDAGANHSCALMGDGSLRCWGDNASGQLGNNTTGTSTVPVAVLNIGSSVSALSVGGSTTCALTINGGVKCWGGNYLGQLGNNSKTDSSTPVDVFGLISGNSTIDVGGNHACAVTSSGDVNCWGGNTYGAVGDGSTLQRLIPSPINIINGSLPNTCTSLPISLGATVSGRWGQVGDCTSGVRGLGFKTDSYTFSAQAGQQIAISLSSADYNSFLYLRDPNGLVIAEDDDGGANPIVNSGRDARIPAKWGYFTVPSSGTYIIEVTSSTTTNLNSEAAYSLVLGFNGPVLSSSSSSASASPCSPVSISGFGSTIAGSLAASDCLNGARGSSYYTDIYSFFGVAGQQVSIAFNSSAFDAYLYLKDLNGTVISSNDDGGGGSNSRIPATSGFFTLPSTGTYTIEATSYSTRAIGAYSLIVNSAASSSSLASSSATVTNSSLAATSGSFSSSAMSSSLSRSSVSSSAVSSSTSSVLGGCTALTITANVTVNGSLSTTDCTNGARGSSYYTDRYTFTAVPGQLISILLTSSAFDTYVFLKDPSGLVVTSNDDGGGGTNSRIPASSGSYTIPAGLSGTYVIEVTSYSTLRTGPYSLTLN